MDVFKIIRLCLTGEDDPLRAQSVRQDEKTASIFDPVSSNPTEEEVASSIVSILFTAEKPGQDLKKRIQAEVHTTGWYEGLAKHILNGIIAALDAGAPMAAAMKEAFEKASAIASDFVKEHPVLTEVIITIIAIGILVILVPWAVEALGFGELGPIRASFAARWQSTFPDVPAGSFFSWLQRLGMTWGKK